MVKRKLAEHDNLKITIQQNGDKFHITESSTFRTKENEFTLGVSFDYTLADGTEVSVGIERSKVIHRFVSFRLSCFNFSANVCGGAKFTRNV